MAIAERELRPPEVDRRIPLEFAPETGQESPDAPQSEGHFYLSEPRSNLLVTPHDPITRLALYIAPEGRWLPRHNPKKADEHHGNHPKRAPALQVPILGPALRGSQIEIVERSRHNEGLLSYHEYLGGTKLPDVDDEDEYMFRLTNASAGFVSRLVIDIEALVEGKDLTREATPKEWKFLRTPGGSSQQPYGYRYVYHSLEPMITFFAHHVTNQRLSSELKEVGEFLDCDDEAMRQLLASIILEPQIEQAVSGVSQTYSEVHVAGQLHPDAPSTAFDLIAGFLNLENPSARLIQKMDAALREQITENAQC